MSHEGRGLAPPSLPGGEPGPEAECGWLQRGLDPALTSVRCANYLVQVRKELLQLSRACGASHPALVTLDHLELMDDRFGARPAAQVFDYEQGWGAPSASDRAAINRLMETGSNRSPASARPGEA